MIKARAKGSYPHHYSKTNDGISYDYGDESREVGISAEDISANIDRIT